MEEILPKAIVSALKKQKYQLVGTHSAVKKCRWLHKSLVEDKNCYKSRFYGISSHRCLQMTPSVAWCDMRCKFCWRVQSYDLEVKWNETEPPIWESAEKIVCDSINAQRKFLSGYKSQVKDGIISIKKFNEAMEPKHVAISLSGEPSLYPDLSELIYEFHKRGFTSFLVTNGTYPDSLERISNNPSQIYVSLCAPNKKVFYDICRPLISNAWEKLMTTLSLIQSFNCPTVIRLTSVKGLNMKNVEEYSKIIREASPSYVEIKAYMYIGYSRKRMRFNNMPNHLEIRRFGESLSERTGYKLVDESPDSRVVLLTKLDKPLPIHNKS